MKQLLATWLAAEPDRSVSSFYRSLIREGLDIPEVTVRRWVEGANLRAEHRAAVARVLGVTEAVVLLTAAGLEAE